MKKNLTLPFEMIKEILLRLPVRSVLRFKCVCKSWLSLISNSEFGTSHHDLAASPFHRLLLRSDDFYVEAIDIDASLNQCFDVVHFKIPPPLPPRSGMFEFYADFHQKHEILGSCRGLMLLHYKSRCELIIWNPSTGDYQRLPYFENSKAFEFLYGFGYDTSKNDYLLILIGLHKRENNEPNGKFQIFSFNTHSWDINVIHVSYEYLGVKFSVGSLLNESLHWLVFSRDKNVPIILVFDLIQRKFSEIYLLDHLTMDNYEVYSLRVVKGCLSVCCLAYDRIGTIEIWMMKEYKVKSSWSKFISMLTFGIPYNFFSPICITRDGRILGSNNRGSLEKFTDNGKVIEFLTYGRCLRLYEENLQVAMYTESLLSLPNILK